MNYSKIHIVLMSLLTTMMTLLYLSRIIHLPISVPGYFYGSPMAGILIGSALILNDRFSLSGLLITGVCLAIILFTNYLTESGIYDGFSIMVAGVGLYVLFDQSGALKRFLSKHLGEGIKRIKLNS